MKVGDSNFYYTITMIAAIISSGTALYTVGNSYAQPTDGIREDISKILEDMGEIKYRISLLEDNQKSESSQDVVSKEDLPESKNSEQMENETITTESFFLTPAFAQGNENNEVESGEFFQKYFISIMFGIIALGSGIMGTVKKIEERKGKSKEEIALVGLNPDEYLKGITTKPDLTTTLDEYIAKTRKELKPKRQKGFEYRTGEGLTEQKDIPGLGIRTKIFQERMQAKVVCSSCNQVVTMGNYCHNCGKKI